MRLAGLELAHGLLLVGRLHLAVADGGDVLGQRKVARDGGIAVREVLVVHRLRLLDERIDHVDLAPLLDLLLHEAEEPQAGRIGVMERADGLAARGQLVDDRYVEVAVERHGQRARNGRGGHHQHMGRTPVLGPEPGALLDAEAMLLVDDHEAEVVELHAVFDQRMGADQNLHLARRDAQKRLAPLALSG